MALRGSLAVLSIDDGKDRPYHGAWVRKHRGDRGLGQDTDVSEGAVRALAISISNYRNGEWRLTGAMRAGK